MTYQKTLAYLDSFINYEKIPYYDYKKSMKLNRIQHFLDLLGNPQRGLDFIHITGTKGKGSTAAIVSSILKERGLKVGLYTSPHLVSLRERIKINGCDISKEELSAVVEEARPYIESMKKTKPPSFFEVYTALAFLYFKKWKVDIAVLEVGIGGRLDATNAADAGIAAITPISLEHTQKLGTTLGEIAYEKSGIIKNGALCITSPQPPEALEVIEEACRRRRATLYRVGRDIMIEEGYFNSREQYFDIWGRFGEYYNLKLKLLGRHQIINAALAVGVAESLRSYGIFISQDMIERGLLNAEWPGRLEVIGEKPKIVLDGAQNAASAEALACAVKRHFAFKRLILILGVSSDKDIEGISRVLSELADEVIVTQVQNPRAAKPETIGSFFNSTKQVTLTRNSEEALKSALSRADKSDLILIAGSLFLVGDLKKFYKRCQTLPV